MPLIAQYTKIKNFEEVCFHRSFDPDNPQQHHLEPATSTLVFLSMVVGLDEITEENCAEWLLRFRIYEDLFGAQTEVPLAKGGRRRRRITLTDIRRHIGLTVNVNPVSRAKWRAHIAKLIFREQERQVSKIMEAAK